MSRERPDFPLHPLPRQRFIDKLGYVWRYVRGQWHPEHRLRMSEVLLGAYPLDAYVHHRDRNPSNNAYENLLLLPARELHEALHFAIDREDAEAIEATELSCLEWMEHIRRHNLLKRPGDYPTYQHRGKPLPDLVAQRTPIRSSRDRNWDEAWTAWRMEEEARGEGSGFREAADARLGTADEMDSVQFEPPPLSKPSAPPYVPIDRIADRSVGAERVTVAAVREALAAATPADTAPHALVGHLGAGGEVVALVMRCPGDGRHWLNAPATSRTMQWHLEHGHQLLGLLPRAVAARALVDLGAYPDQGAALCTRCQSGSAVTE